MRLATVKISKKIVIDSNVQIPILKKIFDDSQAELKEQWGFASHPFTTWKEIQENIPEAVGKINENTSRAIFMSASGLLKKDFPQPLKDVTNSFTISFKTFSFEILSFDINETTTHKIALYFYTDTLTLIDSYSDKLLFSFGDQSQLINSNAVNTFFIQLDETLSIFEYKLI